jgi:PhnB protein
MKIHRFTPFLSGQRPAAPLANHLASFPPIEGPNPLDLIVHFMRKIIAPEFLASKEIIMPTINPYINFNGNAEEAFTFYKSVFGGEFSKIMRFKDLSGPGFHVTKNDADKIMHIALPIGKNTLMANDVPESMGRVNENENRSKISVSAQNKEEADKLFNGLSAGGQVEMPIADSPWGSYFGMFRDKYGIEWTVEFDSKK